MRVRSGGLYYYLFTMRIDGQECGYLSRLNMLQLIHIGGEKRSGGYGIALQVNLWNIIEDKGYLVVEDIHMSKCKARMGIR